MTTTTPVPSLRARLGGRWALSWQATIAGIALVVVLTTATGGGLVEWQASEIPIIFTSACIAGAAIAVYTYAANITVLRNRRLKPAPIGVVVAFHAGIGVLFAGVFLLAVEQWEIPINESPAVSLLGFTLAGLWFCFTMTITLEAGERLRDARRALVDETVRVEMSGLHSARIMARIESSLVAGHVPTATVATAPSLIPLANWWEASQAVRAVDGEDIATHLRRSASNAYSDLHPRSVVAALFRVGQLSPVGTALIVLIAYYRPWLGIWGLGWGLAAVFAMAAIAGLVMRAINHYVHEARSRLAVGVGAMLVVSLAFCGLAVGSPTSFPAAGLYAFAVVGALCFVMLPAAAVSVQVDYERVNDHIARRLEESSDEQRRRAEAAAEYVGSVGDASAELQVGAMSLRQAAASPNPTRLLSALEWGSAYLDASERAGSATRVADCVAAAAQPWEGLLSISCRYDPSPEAVVALEAPSLLVNLEEGLRLIGSLSGAANVDVVLCAKEDEATSARLLLVNLRHDGRPLKGADLPADSRWTLSPQGILAAVPIA